MCVCVYVSRISLMCVHLHVLYTCVCVACKSEMIICTWPVYVSFRMRVCPGMLSVVCTCAFRYICIHVHECRCICIHVYDDAHIHGHAQG